MAFGPGRAGPEAGDTLLIAQLDTVSASVGADDNASGVAVALEDSPAGLRGRDPRVVIALVDLEELMHLGSREPAKTLPGPELDAVLGCWGIGSTCPALCPCTGGACRQSRVGVRGWLRRFRTPRAALNPLVRLDRQLVPA